MLLVLIMHLPLGNRPSKDSIDAALADLAALLGNRLVTSEAVRAQHTNITTWSAEGLPDGVVFPQSVQSTFCWLRRNARDHHRADAAVASDTQSLPRLAEGRTVVGKTACE